MNRTQDYGLKTTNKYNIIWQCHNFKNILIDNFQHHPFLFIERKFCKHHFFTEPKTTYWKDKAINHSNIYLLCDLLWCYYSISWNCATPGNMICPGVWKCLFSRNYTLFFYKHKEKLGWSSTCLRFSQFEPKIILYVMLNFKTYFMAWYCVWYEHCNGLLWVA